LDALTFEQLRLVIVVYSSSIIPLVLIPILHVRNLIPKWVLPLYVRLFFICAIGWEIWFNYGFVAGDNVGVRRADILNQLIPVHLNWVLNSLADAGAICCGGLFLAWLILGRKSEGFKTWRWSVFGLLLVGFIGQNILVEMYLYHDQLSVDKPLSWAPLAPTGPWFNPLLWEYDGRSIMFQSQLPWLIMTPLVYLELIRTLKSSSPHGL